jgi:acetyl-CoA decarbonylase/synthase, CODH/ACS complex subunit gamma
MAQSGLAIYKLLPKTNCKECGFPTCLAFAMKLAALQVDLADCPYVSDEAKQQLAGASAPPIRLITVGNEHRKIEVGNETVLYRHEKTFYHQPGFFYRLDAGMDEDAFQERLQAIVGYEVERVGQELAPEGVALADGNVPADVYAKRAKQASAAGALVILLTTKPEEADAACAEMGGSKPLIYAATPDNWEQMAAIAAKHKVPLAVRGTGDLDELAELAAKIAEKGAEDLVLDPGTRGWAATLEDLTRARRAAIRKGFRPLGYPVITFPGEGANGPEEEALLAAQHVAKYAGFVVMDHFDPAALYTLLTLRQNIYTDPQKPIQVSPGLYPVGDPTPEAPLLVTTNFSLTYFSVAGEVEGSGIPAWLLIADAEGMSVLTAWAAGKFDADSIAKAVSTMGVLDKISHRRIVIPGFVATISGELEEELPDWEILVGPRESIGIPGYLKQLTTA